MFTLPCEVTGIRAIFNTRDDVHTGEIPPASQIVADTTLPVVIESALRKGPNGRVDANNDELAKFYEKTVPEYVTMLGEMKKLRQAREDAEARDS